MSSYTTKASVLLSHTKHSVHRVLEGFIWFSIYLNNDSSLLNEESKGTVLNRVPPSMHGGLIEITLAVPLTSKYAYYFKKETCKAL